MELPSGATQSLNTLHVRATEYTVGPNGPVGNARHAASEQFLHLLCGAQCGRGHRGQRARSALQPAGGEVCGQLPGRGLSGPLCPKVITTGNRGNGWRADSGRVVQVLAVVDSQAILDVDGSGSAATPAGAGSTGHHRHGTTQACRTVCPRSKFLAGAHRPLHHLGQQLGLRAAERRHDGESEISRRQEQIVGTTRRRDRSSNARIRCWERILALTGVRFGLHYNSERVPGRIVARRWRFH